MALAACGGDQPAGPGNGPGSPGISAAAARSPAGRIRTLDDDLSDLAGEIPGFGGVFYDENGTLMVRLKDEGQMATARGRVEAFLTRRAQGNSARMAQVAREVGGMRALPAQYDFRELRAMYLRDVVPVARVEDGVTPPTFTSAADPRCPSGRSCRYSDAALFRYNDPATSNHGKVAMLSVEDTSTTTTNDILAVTGLTTVYDDTDPLMGYPARKVGSFSGHSMGTVDQTCVDLPQSQNNMDTGRTLLCQDVASYAAREGDSGSPVFYFFPETPDGSLITALGLHWGGNVNQHGVATITLFSPISAVLTELRSVMTFGINIIGN